MKKNKNLFDNRATLDKLIETYFEGADKEAKGKEQKAEPPTIAGLAFALGFESKDELERYESKGKFASSIKRARLKVIANYESRLHYPSPTGAVFALKSMGWYDKPKEKSSAGKIRSIKIKLVDSGPQTASSEKDVVL